jgi:hypothetical protein
VAVHLDREIDLAAAEPVGAQDAENRGDVLRAGVRYRIVVADELGGTRCYRRRCLHMERRCSMTTVRQRLVLMRGKRTPA